MSNCDSPGTCFVKPFLATFLVAVLGSLVLLVLIDPYDSLHLSPPLDRGVMVSNQRFSYPAVARSAQFDSLIIGTSTTRMLKPQRLNQGLKARFANLSMNSATWGEQNQIFKLFVKHHPRPKRVIFGIDVVWCNETATGGRLTPRPFPPWLYDDNPWNDYLHLLNFHALENAGRQLAYLLGLRRSRFGLDGYRTLNDKGVPYSLEKARRNIYGQSQPIPPAKPISPPQISAQTRRSWTFPNLGLLAQMLNALPQQTRVLLIFVPYHRHSLGPPGGSNAIKYAACKAKVAQIIRNRPNVRALDFMFASAFTSDDSNYWDVLHYNDRAAKRIDRLIIDYWRFGKLDPRYARPLK